MRRAEAVPAAAADDECFDEEEEEKQNALMMDMPTTRYCTFKFNGQSFKPK